jgi:DNA invertase Pin-like site-specific DNA recombinase
MRTTTPLRLDLVLRTSKRKKDARSPQQQIDMATACAEANGYEIVMVHDSGTDESGKTMNRASLRAAARRRDAGLTDGMIVALADRLGRAPIEEAMTTVREWCTSGTLVIADMGGQPINLNDGISETNIVLQLQMARQFWLATANRFLRSQRDAMKAGKYLGPTPLGYRREGGRLYPHPINGPIVREAYLVAGRDGLHAAVAHMQRAIPTRRWDTDHMRHVLRSRAYLGESHYKGHEPNLNAHDALVSLPEWMAAQTDAQDRRANGEYPLSHAVHCGKCSSGLVGGLQTVPKAKGGYTYRRMRCSGRACRGGSSITADKLEQHIKDVMAVLLADDAFRDQFSPDGLAEAEAALHKVEDARRRFAVDTEARDLLGEDDWRAGLHAHADAVIDARARYNEVAQLAGESETLPLAHELDDPEQFARALRALCRVRRLVVAPGRGSVADRLTLVPHERDDVAGSLAA